MPVSDTVADPALPLVIVSVAVSPDVTVAGVNTTGRAVVAPGAIEAGNEGGFTRLKELALVPLICRLVIVAACVPGLVTVTNLAALGMPTV